MLVAIDGPGGVGKTTVSRLLAGRLGVEYLDTGAYYRTATLLALRGGIDPADEDAVVTAVEAADLDFDDGAMLLDGSPVGPALRGSEVTAHVSIVSAHPRLRKVLVARQRAWVRRRGGAAVVEGRDIGTVVFPRAPVKVFLTAPEPVRAARRTDDPEATGRNVEEVAADLRRRDSYDSERTVAPLRPAADAFVIDTSHLGAGQVADRILQLVVAGGES